MNDTPAPAQRYWPLGQLVLARLREFWREPEAVFWVYGFPVLTTLALGVAFRNRPVERVRVDVADGQAPPADLEALPGVRSVRQEAGGVSLQVNEPHVALPALLDRLRQAGLELAHLATRHASLEDVFVQLTGRHLRDEEATSA